MSRLMDCKIAQLRGLDVAALRMLWGKVFGRLAPARMSRGLLVRAVAYEIQAKEQGGLRPALRRRLALLAGSGRDGSNGMSQPVRTLQPGVRLMREWNGETHMVEVLADGLSWRGNRYRSLSAVAHAITGSRWSGPRFFGLARTGNPPEQSELPEHVPILAGAVERIDV